jgi:hypothetical protein
MSERSAVAVRRGATDARSVKMSYFGATGGCPPELGEHCVFA